LVGFGRQFEGWPVVRCVWITKEVRRMELKELVLEVELLEEKIAPVSVSGGR
jgi:hypothetical protein